MRPLPAGSGKFVMPWLRMHWENLSARDASRRCCSTDAVGSKCWQALWAAWYRELLAASWLRVTLLKTPLLLGSGKFGTPFERMQWEKASAPFCCAGAAGGVEDFCVVFEPTCATWLPGALLHAGDSRASPAMAMIAAAVRAVVRFMPVVLRPGG